MATNPLVERAPIKTTWDLESYCHRLNSCRFVHDSGKPYFIAQRADADGSITRYITR